VLHKVAHAALDKRAAQEEANGIKTTQKHSGKLTATQLLEAFKDMLKEDELNLYLPSLQVSARLLGASDQGHGQICHSR